MSDSMALAGLETLLKEAGCALERLGNIINDAPYRAEARDGAWQGFLQNEQIIKDALRTLLAERENLMADRPVLEPLKLNLYGRACYRAGQQSIRAERDTTEAETRSQFYERRLREEWVSVGGTTNGSWFYHPLLPGFSGDSRSGWKYLIGAINRRAEAAEAHLLTTDKEPIMRAPTTEPSIVADLRDGDLAIPMAILERDWVEHAAKLRNLPLVEYVRRAINLSLMSEGVDAVLLAQSDDDGPCACGALEGDECACPALGDDGEDGVMF